MGLLTERKKKREKGFSACLGRGPLPEMLSAERGGKKTLGRKERFYLSALFGGDGPSPRRITTRGKSREKA